ncbi:MAG: pilus assembly protein [Chloroflexia bacterium]|nr:pilus assembly protein [Chloroflexia bacterium]
MKLTQGLRQRDQTGRPRKRRGQAVIEMALVMTVLLTVSFGMVDFGLYLNGYIRATNCVREVARQAAIRHPAALSACDDHQLTPLFETITGPTTDPTNYKCITTREKVTVKLQGTYRWKAIAGLINAFFPGSVWNEIHTFTVTSTMRLEPLREGTC